MFIHTHKQTMYCRIANPLNLDVERPLTITVYLGNQVQTVGTIRIREPLNLLVILIPIFCSVIILIIAIFIVVLMLMQKCQKRLQLTAMQNLGQRWVSPVHTVCIFFTICLQIVYMVPLYSPHNHLLVFIF